jgi:hypothetical protein
MKLFSFDKEYDFGYDIRYRFFIFSKFTLLTFTVRTTEFPELIPYLQISIGESSLFYFITWIYNLSLEIDVLSKNWSFK